MNASNATLTTLKPIFPSKQSMRILDDIDYYLRRIAKPYDKGHNFHLPQINNSVYFILNGHVRLGYYSGTGKSVTRYILHNNEAFALHNIFDSTSSFCEFGEAISRSYIAELTKDRVQELMQLSPEFAQKVMSQFGNRLRGLEIQLDDLIHLSSSQRVIHFIVYQAEKRLQLHQNKPIVLQFLRHTDIADLTSTSRQTVTTTLNTLQRLGLISIYHKRLVVEDLQSLKGELKRYKQAS